MSFIGDVSPNIAVLGSMFYFDPATIAHGRTLGLGARRFYFLGRGGMLGNVEWPVVQSAFGYFRPAHLEEIWTTSLDKIQPNVAASEFLTCCQEYGRVHFSGVEGLERFCESAEAILDSVDVAGLTLFAAMTTTPLADDAPARAYQLVTRLREHRGSAHLLAVVAAGVDPRIAHAIRRPNDLEMFGWAADDIPEITDEDRARLAEADRLTDRMLEGPYGVVREDQQGNFKQVLADMMVALGFPAE